MSVVSGIKSTSTGFGNLSGLGTKINIYPNPTHGVITIDGLSEDATISIFDTFGNEIRQLEMLNSGEIDLSSQPKGVYFIRIESEKGKCFKKVILN